MPKGLISCATPRSNQLLIEDAAFAAPLQPGENMMGFFGGDGKHERFALKNKIQKKKTSLDSKLILKLSPKKHGKTQTHVSYFPPTLIIYIYY